MNNNGAGFVHLHIHTEYSIPEAVCRLEPLLEKAASWVMTSLAITDKGAIHGAIRFYELAEEYGVHPIIGCEMKISDSGDTLLLLAAKNAGYERIVEWLNFGSYPQGIEHGDIIALSGGRSGMIGRFLASGDTDAAERKALEYAALFGKENFYLEIQNHGADDAALIEQTVRLSDQTGISLVATHDVHYLVPEDESLIHILRNNADARQTNKGAYYLPSPCEMKNKFARQPDAIQNTVNIAQRCNFHLEPGKYKLPRFPVPQSWEEQTYLSHLCREGLRQRYAFELLGDPEQRQIMDRLNREEALRREVLLCTYFASRRSIRLLMNFHSNVF